MNRNLKCGTNKPVYKTETDSDIGKRLVVARVVSGRIEWGW